MSLKLNCKRNAQNDSISSHRSSSYGEIFDKLIWGIEDVSRFTSYSKGTIYNLVSWGEIPYRKSRGKLLFIPSEILQWIKGEV